MGHKIPATDALADLGYRSFTGRAYRASWSNMEVEHFICLEPGRPAAPPSASFALLNTEAELFALKSVIRYGWSVFQTLLDKRDDSSCLMRFPFSRLDPQWNRTTRRMSDPAFAVALKHTAEQLVLPLTRDVTSKERLFRTLICDDGPFVWIGTNGAIRAAIIVALAAQVGIPPDQVRMGLQSKAVLIRRGLSKHSAFGPIDYVERVQQDWMAGLR
jgi:hypothetical protein